MKRYIYLFITILMLSSPAVFAFANEQYTVNYNYGIADVRSEHIVNPNPGSIPKGQKYILSDPECDGFEFAGWFTDDSHKNQITHLSAEQSENITLYAKWYEKSYKINYVLESNESSINSSDIENNNPLSRKTSESVYLGNPVCISGNFIFQGWFTDSDYTNPIASIDSYFCNDITLYAKWQGRKFSVIYDMGSAANSTYATSNPNPDSYFYGDELILQPAENGNPDFTFAGWFEDSLFTNEITSLNKNSSGDKIIYAKWIVKEYPVNYVLADNSGIDENTISHSNPLTRQAESTVSLSDATSSDKNFKFAGWYTSPDFEANSKITKIPANTNATITLYAKWVIAEYSISYDYAMINQMYLKIDNPNPEKYNFGDNFELHDISAKGFIFNGWCTDSARKNKITALPKEIYGDITLYADFTEMTYIISYELGSNEVSAESVVNQNTVFVRTTTEQISLKEAQTLDTNYAFDGWYLDRDYTEEVEYIRAYTTGNITLYAKWEKVITYVPVWGDVTLSDDITAADSRLILRYSAGLESEFTQLQKDVSDINNDGKINAADARIVLRLSAHIDDIDEIMNIYDLPEIAAVDGEIVFIPAANE